MILVMRPFGVRLYYLEKNTASYKFSLAKSLLDLAKQCKSVVSYEELAEVYTPHLLDHYKSGRTLGQLIRCLQKHTKAMLEGTSAMTS